jgi:sirohydrochlorin ferrochelatase
VLVGCAHGTRDPVGQATTRAVLAGVSRVRRDVDVLEAYVDVQEPELASVVADVLDDPSARVVVVPLLLSVGYHVGVDVAEAVAGHAGRAIAAPPLGPDPRLVELLLIRLAEAGTGPSDAVVVAAAGSSDARAREPVEQVATAVAAVHTGPVSVGYGASASPSVPEAVAEARAAGARRVVVASYLLAPGFFHSQLATADADAVTAPLAPDRRLVEVVLDRYAAAAALLDRGTTAPGTRAGRAVRFGA